MSDSYYFSGKISRHIGKGLHSSRLHFSTDVQEIQRTLICSLKMYNVQPPRENKINTMVPLNGGIR